MNKHFNNDKIEKIPTTRSCPTQARFLLIVMKQDNLRVKSMETKERKRRKDNIKSVKILLENEAQNENDIKEMI
jgi:hypothetical protein